MSHILIILPVVHTAPSKCCSLRMRIHSERVFVRDKLSFNVFIRFIFSRDARFFNERKKSLILALNSLLNLPLLLLRPYISTQICCARSFLSGLVCARARGLIAARDSSL